MGRFSGLIFVSTETLWLTGAESDRWLVQNGGSGQEYKGPLHEYLLRC